MIKIEHLRKEYPNVTPLKDVCVEINKGDVISVIGPSGTGKSTLLRCLNQLEEPTSGTVTFDGEVITDPKCDISLIRRKMGMVFQSFNLFSNLNIIENVMSAPVNLLKIPKEQARREGMELLKRVGLAEKAENYPDELSGGQKQRVAIARAIAMKPEMILFDEPTSALDPTMVGEVLSVIRSLAKEGMTMMIVTHEMKFARDVSNRVFYMDEGGIYEDGTPQQIFEDPMKEKTRIFIKRLKQLTLEIASSDFDFIGFISKIDRFGRDNLIDARTVRNMQLAFEELVTQNIVGRLDREESGFPINISAEYSETDASAVMTISYGGGKYDPFTDGDELSVMIVKKLASEINYARDEKNVLTVKFSS
ncbi:MAG: ATP-binding cassette domain-containing protein [Ruminiclostridium sp.]|nr:ATP-binding cassette domain-containing protein [Ruminiclostridium sp.]